MGSGNRHTLELISSRRETPVTHGMIPAMLLCPPHLATGYFLSSLPGMQHVQLDPDGREGEGGGGCCCVVLPAVGRVASMAGSSHLWEFPGCKLDLAGRAQQGSCRGWAG